VSTPGTPDPIREARERALAAFVEPGPLPDSARTEDAETQLLAALERELGVKLDEPARTARALRPASDPAGGGVRASFARLFAGPAWRPALAVAAVLVVVAGAWSMFLAPERAGEPADEPRLRGSETSDGTWNAEPRVGILVPSGSRILHWNAAAGATDYTVVFLAADLSEIARVEHVAATTLRLNKDALPVGLESSTDVLWRVTAYAGADEIARSTASPVTLP
jgi:hypothetical protein